MLDTNSQKYPGYRTYQLFLSPAYRQLKPAARDILDLILYEIKMTPASNAKKGKKYSQKLANRNEIIMPYREIEKTLGYSQKTIWASFRQILAHGFLEVVKHGGGNKSDLQVYGIREDWRRWKPGQVIREIQRNGKIGFQKKISSTAGNPPCSSIGKKPPIDTDGGLPRGKVVGLKSLDNSKQDWFTSGTALNKLPSLVLSGMG